MKVKLFVWMWMYVPLNKACVVQGQVTLLYTNLNYNMYLKGKGEGGGFLRKFLFSAYTFTNSKIN